MTSPHDLRILLWLQLKEWSLNLPAPHVPRILSDVKTWSPPQISFLKLNFDGASKGNPRKAGVGGVLRDSGGNIIRLYATSIGSTTNNATEFEALE
jgi:hypothetical protein